MPHVRLAGEMGALARGPAPTPRPSAIGAPGRSSDAGAGRLAVFRVFSRFLAVTEKIEDALSSLNNSLDKLCQAYQEQGPSIDRLEALELSRHQWEAMCEGLLQKAEGKLRAANNAEARERANKKSYEHLLDPLTEDGLDPEAPARHPDSVNDVPASEADRLQAMRLDVAPSPKALAQRAKFGVR